jgi:hypothetical protein
MTTQSIATVIVSDWVVGAFLVGLVACCVVCAIMWLARPAGWGFCGRRGTDGPANEGLER